MDRKQIVFLFSLLFFLAAVFARDFFVRPHRRDVSSTQKVDQSIHSDRVQSSVNRHLMIAAEKSRLEEARARAMNPENTETVSEEETVVGPNPHASDFVDPQNQDHNQQSLLNDIRSQTRGQLKDPEKVILNEMADQQVKTAEHKRYLEEFKALYIANARKLGYLVEINDKYEVVKVKAIRGPQSEASGPVPNLQQFNVTQFLRAPFCPFLATR